MQALISRRRRRRGSGSPGAPVVFVLRTVGSCDGHAPSWRSGAVGVFCAGAHGSALRVNVWRRADSHHRQWCNSSGCELICSR